MVVAIGLMGNELVGERMQSDFPQRCKLTRVIVGVLVLLSVLLPTAAATATGGESILLDRSGQFEFEPESVEFIVAFDSGMAVQVPGFIAAPRMTPGADPASSVWRFGVQVRLPLGTSVVRSVATLRGKGGEIEMLPSEEISVDSEEGELRRSVDKLRESAIERKRELVTVRDQIRAVEAQIAGVRSDAERIAELSRILEVREESERLRAELRNLEKDRAALNRFVELASSYPLPKNLVPREQQLTRQLTLLAQFAP